MPTGADCFNNGDGESDSPSLRRTLDSLQPTTQSGHEDVHQCRFCPFSSRYVYCVAKHEKVHAGEKPFRCSVCDKAFSKSALLKQHMRTHTGEKPFRCEVCQKAFLLRTNLVVHKRVHTGEKPYPCRTCGKPFADKSTLSAHERIHSGEQPYRCKACGRTFRQSSSFNRHWKTTHSWIVIVLFLEVVYEDLFNIWLCALLSVQHFCFYMRKFSNTTIFISCEQPVRLPSRHSGSTAIGAFLLLAC